VGRLLAAGGLVVGLQGGPHVDGRLAQAGGLGVFEGGNGYHPEEFPCTNLDADWLWRRLVYKHIWRGLGDPIALAFRGFQALCLDLLPQMAKALVEPPPERGPLHRQLVLGSSIGIVMLVLALFLWLGHSAS
jgi:hypothetical protein